MSESGFFARVLVYGRFLAYVKILYRRYSSQHRRPRFRLVVLYVLVLLRKRYIRNDIHRIITSHAVIISPPYSYRLPVQVVQYFRDFERTAKLVQKQNHFAVVIVNPTELVICSSISVFCILFINILRKFII